jgi:hypothetical protein
VIAAPPVARGAATKPWSTRRGSASPQGTLPDQIWAAFLELGVAFDAKCGSQVADAGAVLRAAPFPSVISLPD